ncbi:lipase family protein [Corynebacterium sp. p3-SID1056]|uniref:lipase family protein n=1 Tax=Corynebacterium sp. p3-SID1056 TaxID=2916092 RepID=UPI0021A39528|nr:lipase family protein [Corynebacterium sp. p3-SID1056]MCT2338799.1 lipase family protein [Corynebacterium sp. p3-SID1056]
MGTYSAALRAALGLAADTVRGARREEPEHTQAAWVIGRSAGALLEAREIKAVGLTHRVNPAEAWHIDYVTADASGRTLAATGAVFRSRSTWRGTGPRPTIAFAPSTQGVATRCDPSYSCTVGLAPRLSPFDLIAAYEQPAIALMLARGANVVLTDYPRDPTDNVQLYCDHVAAAQSLIDATRAATSLSLGTDALGLWGFSQGGGAVGAWLERPEYAPELQPLAAVCGAPPAALIPMLDHVDGALPSIVILYAVAGLIAHHPRIAEELVPHLSPAGAAAIVDNAQVCAVGAALRRPWAHTTAWTREGIGMAELLDALPYTAEVLERQALGQRRPLRIPLRLWASLHDDIVPYALVHTLAEQWGVPLATRRLLRLPGRTGLNHYGPYFQHLAGDVEWLLRQLGG